MDQPIGYDIFDTTGDHYLMFVCSDCIKHYPKAWAEERTEPHMLSDHCEHCWKPIEDEVNTNPLYVS